ncbi:UvrD-helicase domain-containing protein [Agromyces badenianii]|uniref:UvrD-helicase domain-containing protein n=1 Tax=Agromyces badenianii TaxID=2080742 RepID=UPI000D59A922|nr:UvrD-helicase domain-containing protein [Agromyces badenianii]PWC02867.1 DNA helicase II [Agromyces badenianii]
MTMAGAIAAETAEQASEESLFAMFAALEGRRNFKLEAGAGAGKTYSLVQALKHILGNRAYYLPRSDQRVACLTYTKIARDEIKARTDEHPSIFADTLHGFLWEMIRPFQKALAASLSASKDWSELLSERPEIDDLTIEYDLGIRGIHKDRITLHHNDIPELAIQLFGNRKFRSLIADRFPVILIDEYQDTPAGLGEAVISGHGVDRKSPIVGFFGDHWQQIYDRTCGAIEHPTLTTIPKNANFRSDTSVVSFLNRLRPELPQAPRNDAGEGTVTIYHSNSWPGTRQSGQWKGQISHEATQACLAWLRTASPSSAWIQSSEDLKILMLTHATIANELGYPSLPGTFRYNDSFAKKEDPVVEYLVDTIEPALQAFGDQRFGDLFRLLGSKNPMLRAPKDKLRWTDLFESLIATGDRGTVGDVLDLLMTQKLFSVPTRVSKRESDLKAALSVVGSDEKLDEPRVLAEHRAFRGVPYAEVRALRTYLDDSTLFSTKHSVKGAEFDDVIVLLGRGWASYDFAKMIALHAPHSDPELRAAASFHRSRNLFYVSTSRAKHNLALLFVQELDENALAVLADWVGPENLVSIEFDDVATPSLSVSQ